MKIKKNDIYEMNMNGKWKSFYRVPPKGTLLICEKTNEEYKKWSDKANKKADELRKKIAQGVTGTGYSGHIGYAAYLTEGFHEFRDIISNEQHIVHEDDVKLIQKGA